MDKKIEKKKKILDAAFALFQQRSIASTAIDDIVKATGIARGTFYLYFRDKSDLVEQIVLYKSTETIRGVLKDCFEMRPEGDNLAAFARSFLNRYIDFLIDHKDVLMVLSKNIASCLRSLPDFGDDEVNKFYDSIISKMIECGFTEQNAHKTVYIVANTVGVVCSDAILTSRPWGIEELRAPVIEAAIGILEKGIEAK